MAKTRIVTTQRNKAGKRKKGTHVITKKVHRSHKGYPMKRILKGQMTYKKGGKR